MDNDSVSDTPPQLNPTIGCPVFPVTDSCTQNYPGIMFMNFMDYSDETCINMFTIEQGIRMYNSLLFYYPQLTATSPCLPLDISENETIHSIQIYPNPSSGLFKVLLNTKQKLKKIIACNILGEIINLNIQEEVPNYSIDASEIISGIYFLKLDFENWSVVKKFIKN